MDLNTSKVKDFNQRKDKVIRQMTDWEKIPAMSKPTRDQYLEYARTL